MNVSVNGMLPSATFFIMRMPRARDFRAVSAYVGHAERQSPQWMHWRRKLSSGAGRLDKKA
jgi:hypothetical protein